MTVSLECRRVRDGRVGDDDARLRGAVKRKDGSPPASGA